MVDNPHLLLQNGDEFCDLQSGLQLSSCWCVFYSNGEWWFCRLLTLLGTSKGFRIFTTDPFAKSYETKEGNIAILEMLFSTSLVALILSPRRLQITNTKVCHQCNQRVKAMLFLWARNSCGNRSIDTVYVQRGTTICELTFPTTVLAVKLNRNRLAVVLEDQIYVYDIQTMKLLSTIQTSPNPHGMFLCHWD